MSIVEEDVSLAYAAPGQPGALANYRPRYGHYIGGEFVDPVKGQYFENVSPDTVGLVSRRLLGLMPDGATLINTARGPIVDHAALVDEVRAGRLRAVLDVTDPEPLPAGHVLLESPSVIVTPHIAGALGNELRRLGESVVGEVQRVSRGEDAAHAVSLGELAAMA